MSALVSLLETFDVVWAIFQILENAKESDIVEPNKVGRSVRADQLKGGNSLVALSSCSKATRDCLRWIIFDIQRPNRRIPTFLLAGHDDLFCYGSSEESKSHFLELWRASCAFSLLAVDLSGLAACPSFEINLADLPLNRGVLFPNARSLVVENGWSDQNELSRQVHELIRLMLPSHHIQKISLALHASDAARILDLASSCSEVEDLSLSFSSTVRPSPQERTLLASAISNLSRLKWLRIPSSLLHSDTLETFGSLASLQLLELTFCTEVELGWGKKIQLELDDWNDMYNCATGFPHLRHLIIAGKRSARLPTYAQLDHVFPSIRLLTLLGGAQLDFCALDSGADIYGRESGSIAAAQRAARRSIEFKSEEGQEFPCGFPYLNGFGEVDPPSGRV